MKHYLKKVMDQQDLTFEEMNEASRLMFEPETSPVQVAGFLSALKTKGESVGEIAGLVEVIRDKAIQLPIDFPGAMDNCGTGGDGSQSFNISTTSAFVMAGAGMTVAKHGNRSISSKTGSADVLEALGVKLTATKDEMAHLLSTHGIAFLFAQHVHPAMKQVMGIRKSLGVPTIFNLIGPLTNPVKLTTQMVGIYRRDLLEQMANTLHQLGRKRALVINGADYMDEASLAGENFCVLLDRGELMQFTIKPEEVGLMSASNDTIKGGDAEENARILRDVIEGKEGPHRDVVLLNAGLGLFANGKAQTVQEGVQLAKESIDSKKALAKLDGLVDFKYDQDVKGR
ncbi:anthranilate phosphoribosyltransferase [Pelagirhabdus alkalitolerans]|uniref:Anthranilate phosphoribosyltransferase n=1 Tax=Pelagirhabdus alkalitolerans TaxID=1612202 RepID=A0A1G6GJC2_9BACI|nr:anthranilate phosphoribosyltransferase [Pelagirhabdus alkalitolerans]SDB82040.1 anthranilate phosphoribosyltransferase [Pelagirhabdus alkalitolerans]